MSRGFKIVTLLASAIAVALVLVPAYLVSRDRYKTASEFLKEQTALQHAQDSAAMRAWVENPQPRPFASSGRILTIEQWYRHEGTAWAVQENQVVIYRLSDYLNRKPELIATKPLAAGQANAILSAIKRLPKDSVGFYHSGILGTDGPLLRLSFRSDGWLDLRGIELCGYYPRWIDGAVSLVSSISKPEAPITFDEVISKWRNRYESYLPKTEVGKVSLRWRYGYEKYWWEFWK